MNEQTHICSPNGNGDAMCRYAMDPYKVHYVCLQCRKCFKYAWDSAVRPCPDCTAPMINAGHDFAAPRKNDKKGWAGVAAVLNAGLRYEGFEGCGCLHDPKFRPRPNAQVRARRRIAVRTGTDEATALAARDPDSLENSATS